MRLRDPLVVALLLMLVYTAGLVAALVLLLDRTTGVLAADLAPTDEAGAAATGSPIEVVVDEGMAADAIAARLVERGVIDDVERFTTLVAFTGIAPQLKAGRYEIRPGTPAAEVIRRMTVGLTAEVLVTVPEGLRAEEVGAILADAGLVTPEEWAEALAQPWPHPFLQARPEGAGLNGYLMPASYPAHRDSTAEEIVEAMLDSFAEQVDAALIAEAEARGFTLHEVLTLASIVEREAVVAEEQELIASVFINRLELGMALQADPTVQYAIATPESVAADGWWKHDLTVEELEVDSPYNTYVYPGLPPGPIANPGIAAIRAVVRAPETDYLYFVAAPECDGSHRFAETIEEHNANVEAFLASSCAPE